VCVRQEEEFVVLQALVHLIDLQRIDVKVDALDKQRATIPQKLQELEKKLGEVKAALGLIEAQVSEREREKRTIDTNLQLDGAKLKKWEARLNDIRNQREYLALSRETESQKKANNDAHDRLDSLNTENKDLVTKMEAHRDDVAVLEVDIDAERAEVDAKLKELDKVIDEQKKERAEYLSQIPANVIKRYDQVRTRRGGVATAPVAAGRCTACNMGLPPQLYNTVIRGETIETCPSCLRILYYREPTSETPAQA
jgi:predicted  nucleic acid-binding Zn-ribbon protein